MIDTFSNSDHDIADEPMWTMKDGTQILVKDMETSHIKNCMRLMERNKFRAAEELLRLPMPNGEHAQDAYNQELSYLSSADVSDVFPIYEEMQIELARRAEIDMREAMTKAEGKQNAND